MSIIRKHATKIQAIVAFVAIFAMGFAAGNLTNPTQAQQMGDTDQAFEVIREAYDIIKSRYVDSAEVDVPLLVDGALQGMVESLGDDFSSYLTPEGYADFNRSMEGNVEGIGVVIDTNDEGQIYVVSLIRGAAAIDAGVLPGDIFWEVNGESVAELDQNELATLVRGPAGTEVTVTFKRGEEFVTFTMTRVRFEVPNVEFEILEGDIAYISMAQFTTDLRSQLDNALEEVDVNSRAGLIIDIRDNPGGLLSSVVDVASVFLPEDDVILYETFGDGSEETFTANGDFADIEVPIVLLINGGSASASELLAGAMQDTDRATLIGETTFGKGTVQNIQPISNGGAIRITIARWLTPNRNWIHEFGITPDIEVPYDPATDGVDVDPQLDAAVEFINNQ
jgi:carboxyl-terminal processing protease